MITIHINASKEYDVILKAGVLSEAGRLIREDLSKRYGTTGSCAAAGYASSVMRP